MITFLPNLLSEHLHLAFPPQRGLTSAGLALRAAKSSSLGLPVLIVSWASLSSPHLDAARRSTEATNLRGFVDRQLAVRRGGGARAPRW